MTRGPVNERPTLLVQIELEDALAAFIVSICYEDEQRVRRWLSSPAPRRRLVDEFAAVIESLAEGREP